tara:strand:+ start:29 stop:316 length:288 start_codon:yes stop_codon:yes gene_type:complete
MITLINSENKIVEIGDNGGGQYFLDVNGTIAANGTVKVLVSIDGTNYSPLTTAIGSDLSITDDYNAVIMLPSSSFIKFDATSIGSTGVKVNLVKV